jgi:hypothetical protein
MKNPTSIYIIIYLTFCINMFVEIVNYFVKDAKFISCCIFFCGNTDAEIFTNFFDQHKSKDKRSVSKHGGIEVNINLIPHFSSFYKVKIKNFKNEFYVSQ